MSGVGVPNVEFAAYTYDMVFRTKVGPRVSSRRSNLA
jgi:hypothetical protein